jgi:hypothetical protein
MAATDTWCACAPAPEALALGHAGVPGVQALCLYACRAEPESYCEGRFTCCHQSPPLSEPMPACSPPCLLSLQSTPNFLLQLISPITGYITQLGAGLGTVSFWPSGVGDWEGLTL